MKFPAHFEKEFNKSSSVLICNMLIISYIIGCYFYLGFICFQIFYYLFLIFCKLYMIYFYFTNIHSPLRYCCIFLSRYILFIDIRYNIFFHYYVFRFESIVSGDYFRELLLLVLSLRVSIDGSVRFVCVVLSNLHNNELANYNLNKVVGYQNIMCFKYKNNPALFS